ncbi:MAG: hypothetical protein Q7R91_02510 [bacterium]|nr:hypothetical protein [bacterium]
MFNACWSRETSSDPDGWTPENSSYGHCALATLAAQEMFDGKLLRYDLKGTPYEHMGSHYKLRLPDGIILDFTEAQFQGKPPVWGEPKVRTRDELLDPAINPRNQETRDRYTLFMRHINSWLTEIEKVPKR